MTSSNVLNSFNQLDINERGDCLIDNINNDCLISIFEYLTLEEKIMIELVCKRWNQVVKLSWNHVNSINFYDFIPYYSSHGANKKEKMKNNFLLKNVLKRCSSYLTKIIMYSDDVKNLEFNEFVEDLSKYCLNVNNLSIFESYNKFFTDDKLIKLFSFFVNLNTLNLSQISVTGDFFLNLKSDNIKELSLIGCKFSRNNNFYKILSKLKNLNKFAISHESASVINQVVESLIASNCENLTEFIIQVDNSEIPITLRIQGDVASMSSTESSSIKSLPIILSRQKKLCKFELTSVLVNPQICNSLQTECLTDLLLDFHNVKPGIINFHNFGNLKKFTGYFDKLTNVFFEAISTCLKLKHLEISCDGSINCVGSFDYLHKLENLESFKIKNSEISAVKVNFDDVLQGLWQCKNLKYLTLKNCSYTNLSLQNLGSDSNLVNFNTRCDYRYGFRSNNDITNEQFYEFLRKTPFLRKFSIGFCNKITKKLIEDVALLKKNRNDKHELEMNFYKCDGLGYENLKNLSPLVNVINDQV